MTDYLGDYQGPEGKSEYDRNLITKWNERISAAKRYRKKFSDQDKWEQYRKMYRGSWVDDILPVNQVFSSGRSILPRVYFKSPRISVTATRPDMIYHARVVEEVDNWLIREMRLKHTLKRAALLAFLNGIGPIKLGYDSQYGYMPAQSVDEDSSTITQVARGEKGRKIEYNTTIKPGMPWALRELPENVIVPFGYSDPHSLPWIANRIIRPLQDIRQDQKYKNIDKLRGTLASSVDDMPGRERAFMGMDDIIYGELYEIRDAAEQKIITICENQILLEDLDTLQIEGLPWEFLIFNEDPEFFWPIPDVKMIEGQQLDLNLTRTQLKKHKAIALVKFLYLKDAISEPELEKFLSGLVGPAVRIDGESLAQAILPLQPHVPPDLYADMRNTITEIEETLGTSPNYRGGFKGGTPPTAAETVEVASSGNERDGERRDIVADCLVDIMKKVNQFIFKLWTSPRVAKIAGPEGVDNWVEYTGDELEGEYTLIIDPDSGMPVSRQVKTAAGMDLVKTYNGDPLTDQTKLRLMHLQNYEWIFPGVSQILQNLNPEVANPLASVRQPSPAYGAGGSGAKPGERRGGRSASTPENPVGLDKLKEKLGGV